MCQGPWPMSLGISWPNVATGPTPTSGGRCPNPSARPCRRKNFLDYVNRPSEKWAEAVRQYNQNPTEYKRSNPEAAKWMREINNKNPRLNQFLTLSKNEKD